MRRIRTPWQFSAVAALACAIMVVLGIRAGVHLPWYPLVVGCFGLLNAAVAWMGWLVRK